MTLRDKTVNGIFWTFIGDIFNKIIIFAVGILLARILSPSEYGLVAIVTIFTSLSIPLANSGFSQALIRKNSPTQNDYSTVFYFNFFIGLILYILLYFLAPSISNYFHEQQLIKITRVTGLIIIFNAATIIQTTIITKEMKFKLQARIMVISSLLSGVIGVYLALKGYGVWSLVYKMISLNILQAVMLWFLNNWRPNRGFSISSLKELFGFGSKLMISGIIDKIYGEIYNLVIARYFSAIELGLYSRADMFKKMVSSNISEIITKVSFPALASMQQDTERVRSSYKKIYISTMFITMILLLGMAACSDSIILALLGHKWQGTIEYLQLLCFVGMYYPILGLTRNILYVFGKGGLVVKLEIFTKILAIPVILIGIKWGITYLLIAMIITGFIETLVKSSFLSKMLSYPVGKQIYDVIPGFIIASMNAGILYLIGMLTDLEPLHTLIIQLFTGTIFMILLLEIFKIPAYTLIKDLIKVKIIQLIKHN